MLHIVPQGAGWVEVICGCMFSGKTEELIRRLRRASIARQSAIVFKPMIDDRYHATDVVSHNEQRIPSVPVRNAHEIEEMAGDYKVIGIDEAQFIEGDLTGVARRLANHGRRVIVAGLDTDYRGIPFEPIPALMCEAEYVTKLTAVCHTCGAPAHRTQRIGGGSKRVEVGGLDRYQARCRACWEPPREDGLAAGQTGLDFRGDNS